MIHPLIVKESSTKLLITGEQYKKLIKKPKAILWCRDGLYGMVPVEVVKNAILFDEDKRTLLPHLHIKRITFNWNETVEIPASTGLSMEKYNGN